MRTNFPLEPDGVRYTIETPEVTGYLTECAWQVSKNGANATLYLLSCIFGSKQKALSLRAAIIGNAQVNIHLPYEQESYGYNAYHHYEAIQTVRKKSYGVKILPKIGYEHRIIEMPNGCFQLLYYPSTAKYHSTENETVLLMKQKMDQPKHIFGYLQERFYFPIMRKWIDHIWNLCERSGMIEKCLTLGAIDVYQISVRPRPIRELISTLLQQGRLPIFDEETRERVAS